MKICIPTVENNGVASQISSHFGQADWFAIFDDATQELIFLGNNGHHHGGTLTPAEIIANSGAQVVLCGGLGAKAVHIFEERGIHVYCQAAGTVAETLDAYRANKLPEATDANACQHHQHDHAHV